MEIGYGLDYGLSKSGVLVQLVNKLVYTTVAISNIVTFTHTVLHTVNWQWHPSPSEGSNCHLCLNLTITMEVDSYRPCGFC